MATTPLTPFSPLIITLEGEHRVAAGRAKSAIFSQDENAPLFALNVTSEGSEGNASWHGGPDRRLLFFRKLWTPDKSMSPSIGAHKISHGFEDLGKREWGGGFKLAEARSTAHCDFCAFSKSTT